MGTCNLGDACHFAHVPDPTYEGVEKEDKSCWSWGKRGRCEAGDKCKFVHAGEGGEDNSEGLTEERLKEAFEEMRARDQAGVDQEDDGDDDDVEIVSRVVREGDEMLMEKR
jgi:hypothetical protein